MTGNSCADFDAVIRSARLIKKGHQNGSGTRAI